VSSFKILSLKGLNFGRFSNRAIDDLGHSFIVVHGANESGKSTLTEIITWMTGGPVGKAADAQRFGEPEQVLTGRLIAELNGQPADIEGKFKVKKTGTPNDARTGTVGASGVTAREVMAQLGHLQADDYAFIYRFIGPVLHDTESAENFESILSQFAIGSAVTDINPATIAKELLREAESAKAEANKLKGAIKEIDTKIQQAELSPKRLSEIEIELDRIKQGLQEISEAGILRARHMEYLRIAISSFDKNEEVRALQTQFNSLATPAPEWCDAVKNVADIKREIGEAKALAASLAGAQDQLSRNASQIGLNHEELASRSLTLDQKGQVQSAGNALKDARSAHQAAQSTFDSGANTIREKMSAIRDAAHNLGITTDAASSLSAVIGTWNQLNNAAVTWNNAHGAAHQQQDTSDKADEAVRAAREQVEIEEKRVGPDAPVVSQKNDLPLLAGGAVVGLAAGAFWQGALVISALLIAAVFGVSLRKSRASGGVSVSTSDALQAARLRLSDAQSAANSARENAAKARIDADTAQEVFAGHLSAFGVALPTVELAQDVCVRINVAAQAVQQLRDAETAQRLVEGTADQAKDAENLAQTHFDSVLSSCGITYAGSLDQLSTWLDAYFACLASVKNVNDIRQALTEKESSVQARFADAISSGTDLYSDRLLDDLTQQAKVSEDYENLGKRLADAQNEARAAVGNSEDVQELLKSASTQAELQVQLDALILENNEQESQRDGLVEDRTELRNEKEEIEQQEFINALSLEKSEKEEQREELLAQHEIFATAARTLSEVINEFQAKNQGPLITRANEILNSVVPGYGDLVYTTDEAGKPLIERVSDSDRLRTSKLSTGSRALAYLALRLAFVEADQAKRGIALPVLCDDPLVHIDDQRAPEVIKILQQASQKRQVILFTCHEDTRDLAAAAGAHVVSL
jgi:uncharacterized protein YhaN